MTMVTGKYSVKESEGTPSLFGESVQMYALFQMIQMGMSSKEVKVFSMLAQRDGCMFSWPDSPTLKRVCSTAIQLFLSSG